MPITGALVAVGLATMIGLDASSSWTHLIIGFVISGAGLGMSSALISQAALAAVPCHRPGGRTRSGGSVWRPDERDGGSAKIPETPSRSTAFPTI